MNRRLILRWIGITALLGISTFCVAAWVIAGALVAPSNRPVGAAPEGFASKNVSIASDSGATVAGWFFPVDDATSTVLLLHPLRGDRRAMLQRAEMLNTAGFSTLLIDLQAHGETVGNQITVGHLESRDVTAALQWIRQRSPKHRIGVIGWSLGGAAVLLAQPQQIDALVLESVYPTISEAVHDRVAIRLGGLHHLVAPTLLWQLKPRLGISASQLRPIDHLKKVRCPVLIVAGDNDQHTKLSETKRMFACAPKPKELVIFPGAPHTDLLRYDRDKYAECVFGFLKRYLESAKQTSNAIPAT